MKTSDDQLIKTGYIDRKDGNGDAYNYDLFPLIKNFSFHQFVYEAIKNKEYYDEYGGFLIITSKQYIIGYNAGFGLGTHISSFARTMKELCGGGIISSSKEVMKLSHMCKTNYIIGRITYEKLSSEPLLYKGGIIFKINNENISLDEFLVFEKFYEDYNYEIKSVINKYGEDCFKVVFHYKEKGVDKINISYSLDDLFEFLKSHIDYEKDPTNFLEDEIILGEQPTFNKIKKYK